MPATTICATSLPRGDMPITSSQMPTIRISVPPKISPIASCRLSLLPNWFFAMR